jgi:endonuclease/exonuclease/phosphatase family metal-dependent hydrolase
MRGLSRRPTSLPGLALAAARLRARSCLSLVIFAIALMALGLAYCGRAAPVRVATFNIENFPRDARQIEGAFAAIDALEAPVIAVQEITDPATFAREARERLGEEWRFVADDGGGIQRVGVLFDAERYTLAWSRTHDETRTYAGGKPTLEVRLRSRGSGRALRVLVVHLKAGGAYAHVRREQLRQLRPVVEEAVASWDEVVVLGDFNATGDEDRETIARFSSATGLTWASEPLRCTSYWNRNDGCRGTPLDHVLTRRVPEDIAARGPCETIGCDPGDRCPAFHREVSDHCPVTADL